MNLFNDKWIIKTKSSVAWEFLLKSSFSNWEEKKCVRRIHLTSHEHHSKRLQWLSYYRRRHRGKCDKWIENNRATKRFFTKLCIQLNTERSFLIFIWHLTPRFPVMNSFSTWNIHIHKHNHKHRHKYTFTLSIIHWSLNYEIWSL